MVDIFLSLIQVTSDIKTKNGTGLVWPRGFQEVKVSRFHDNGTGGGKVVSPAHQPPLPPGNDPGTDFCYRLSRPQGHSAIGRILCQ